MEVSQVGVRTRARAMAIVAEETADNSGAVKRRKVGNEKLRSPSSTFEQITKTFDREINVTSAPEEDPTDSCNAFVSLISGGVPACSSTGSMETLKVADLEESFETETAARYKLDGSIESTQTTKVQAELGELQSTTVKSSVTMPTETELEAFFAAAEESLNKRFKDKYNYDIVNDIPLEGRYDWIQITPGN